MAQPETFENNTITSERLSKIQSRISTVNFLPDGLDRKTVKDTDEETKHMEKSEIGSEVTA